MAKNEQSRGQYKMYFYVHKNDVKEKVGSQSRRIKTVQNEMRVNVTTTKNIHEQTARERARKKGSQFRHMV